ncbi:MAG: Rrf2 family transcriptional regulator [bacterium]
MSSFKFRKKTDYGLMMISMLALAGEKKLVSVRAMQEHGLPRSFLVKIARDLIKSGIVGAKEGRSGGYYLAKEPNTVSLLDVVRALEGDVSIADCTVHGNKCLLEEKCPHRKLMINLNAELSDILEKYHLSDFEKLEK